MRKRFLAIVMAVCMLLSVLPTSAFAAEGDTYTVTAYDYNRVLLQSVEVEEGGSVTLNTPTRTGYNFTGFTDSDGNTYTTTIDNVTSDLTLTATYAVNTYTVKFVVDTNDNVSTGEIESQSVVYNTRATEPTEPEDADDLYYFDGWYTDKDFTTEFSFFQLITEDTTLYAKWTTQKVNVVFVGWKGVYECNCTATYTVDGVTYTNQSVDFPLTVDKGTSVTVALPTISSTDTQYQYSYTQNNVTKSPYFRGWYIPGLSSESSSTGGGPQQNSNMVLTGTQTFTAESDVTISAVYEPETDNHDTKTYQSTTAYVTVLVVDEITGEILGYTVVTVDLTSNNGSIKYGETTISDTPYGTLTTSTTLSDSTARFATYDLQGTEIETDSGTYTIESETLAYVRWICSQKDHVYGGTCAGGCWNAVGAITVYVTKNVSLTEALIYVNHIYVNTDGTEELIQINSETVDLSSEGYTLDNTAFDRLTEDYLQYYGYEWKDGAKDGDTAVGGSTYTLNLYYKAPLYSVTVNYYAIIDGVQTAIADSEVISNNYNYDVVNVESYLTDSITYEKVLYVLDSSIPEGCVCYNKTTA